MAPGSTNAPTAAVLQAAASEGGLSSRGLGQNGLRSNDGSMDGKATAPEENEPECKDYEDIFPNGEEEDFIILDVVMNVVSDEVVLGFFHIDGRKCIRHLEGLGFAATGTTHNSNRPIFRVGVLIEGLYKGFWSNGICGESKESLPVSGLPQYLLNHCGKVLCGLCDCIDQPISTGTLHWIRRHWRQRSCDTFRTLFGSKRPRHN